LRTTRSSAWAWLSPIITAREKARALADELLASGADADLAKAINDWFAAFNDGEQSKAASKRLEATLASRTDEKSKALYALRDLFVKPSVWIFGGDGWAYDIGYGGLDHVLASGENVNILVFDTEVYSNTGGQASKASRIGQVAQFAASGKTIKKKKLAEMAMQCGYVYVAQVAMGANYQQTLKALIEAESYDGPSIVIAYSPCINHGARSGMVRACRRPKRPLSPVTGTTPLRPQTCRGG
jgi:pyruvate-ferredoxin/flavodoxin oxidoreductase